MVWDTTMLQHYDRASAQYFAQLIFGVVVRSCFQCRSSCSLYAVLYTSNLFTGTCQQCSKTHTAAKETQTDLIVHSTTFHHPASRYQSQRNHKSQRCTNQLPVTLDGLDQQHSSPADPVHSSARQCPIWWGTPACNVQNECPTRLRHTCLLPRTSGNRLKHCLPQSRMSRQ